MEKRKFILRNNDIRHRAKEAINTAPDDFVVELKPITRSLEQNAMLHALFQEAAKKHKWQGRKLTAIQWKVLFISGHAMATGLGADMIPGLEGEFVNIRESSAQMTVTRMTSLIEYVNAWMADNVE